MFRAGCFKPLRLQAVLICWICYCFTSEWCQVSSIDGPKCIGKNFNQWLASGVNIQSILSQALQVHCAFLPVFAANVCVVRNRSWRRRLRRIRHCRTWEILVCIYWLHCMISYHFIWSWSYTADLDIWFTIHRRQSLQKVFDGDESARSSWMSWRQRKAKHPRTSFLTGQSTMAEDNFNSSMFNIRVRIVKLNYEQIRLDTVEVTVGISRVSREWSKLWWAWVEAVGGAAICSFGSGGGFGERTSDGSKRFCKGAIFIQVYPYSMIESRLKVSESHISPSCSFIFHICFLSCRP